MTDKELEFERVDSVPMAVRGRGIRSLADRLYEALLQDSKPIKLSAGSTKRARDMGASLTTTASRKSLPLDVDVRNDAVYVMLKEA